MKLLSLCIIFTTLVSLHGISFAQEKAPAISRSSPNSPLHSPIQYMKDDTVKVNLVHSIPIIISAINDSTKLTKNDTLRAYIINFDTQPKKWQYSYYYIFTNNEKNAETPDLAFLNDKGAEGWELVSVSYIADGKSLVIFKKPL